MKGQNFSTWLKQQMRNHPDDLNQTGLALRIGVSQTTVSFWLRGLYVPSPDNCKIIAELFDVTLDEVLVLAGHKLGPTTIDDLSETYALGTPQYRLARLSADLTDDQALSIINCIEAFMK